MYLQRGLAAAASRLGGRIGSSKSFDPYKKNKLTSGSLFPDYYSSSSATNNEVDDDPLKSKSLHLFFCELIHPIGTRDVVRSIKLSDLLSDHHENDDTFHPIEQETHIDNKYYGGGAIFPWGYGRLGSSSSSSSQVVLPRGNSNMATFDASSQKPSFIKTPKLSTRHQNYSYRFPTALFEVAGKLYCLDTRTTQYHSTVPNPGPPLHHTDGVLPPFSVFDYSDDDKRSWLPLEPPPPSILYNKNSDNKMMHIVIGNEILVWSPNKVGVCSFDVSQPQKGWADLHSPLATTLPFVEGHWGNVTHYHHPRGTLIFTLDRHMSLFNVRTWLLSRNMETMQAMQPYTIQVPPKFLDDHTLNSVGKTECCLVHLGGRKVCLVLHKYFYRLYSRGGSYWDDDCEDQTSTYLDEEFVAYANKGRNKGTLHLITFEYDDFTTESDMQYRILSTRNYEYYTKLNDNEEGTYTVSASLAKAFVIYIDHERSSIRQD